MKRRIISSVVASEAVRYVFRHRAGKLEIGEVIGEDTRSRDHYGNHDITVRWPDRSVTKTRSFWVNWIGKDVDMGLIMDLVDMFNTGNIDIADRESIANFLVNEYGIDWDDAIEHGTEYEKYGKQLTTQSFCHATT